MVPAWAALRDKGFNNATPASKPLSGDLMLTTKSIASTFTLVVTCCSTLIFLIAIGYFYHLSCLSLEKEMEDDTENLVLASVNTVEATLRSIGKVAEGVARFLEADSSVEQSAIALLKRTLEENSDIYGLGAAFEPDTAVRPPRPVVPYFYRNNGQLIFAAEEDFQYLDRDWYRIPRTLGRKTWSEPYFDDGSGKMLMTSYSVPFFTGVNGEKKIRGIVVADVSLDSLTQLVASIQVLQTGYSFLLSHNGTILAHPNKNFIMTETIFSLAESGKNPALREIGKKMVSGESGFLPYTDTNDVTSWMYYAPIPSTGWTLAVVFPEAEMYAGERSLSMTLTYIALGGIVVLTVTVFLIARSITAPLCVLAKATKEIAAGNFDAELPPVRSHDEVGMLTTAFAAMNRALKEYIRNLTETTAAKERIQSELKVATEIQANLLPRLFPPFPDRPEFDIYAAMDPAKEVGGDFYDFFFIDTTHLCFLIADVADKGVPAALYMMVAKTLLKAEGQRLGEPAQILASVNDILASDNDSCMFTTVFCAILNTGSGEVCFANAGHNPPVVITEGRTRYLTVQSGIVLGPMPDAVYATERMVMQPGDILFLYTDGITEAKNPDEELYGEARLLAGLQQRCHDNPTGLIHGIRADVTRYANGAPQSDDVTMVAVQYRGAMAGGSVPSA